MSKEWADELKDQLEWAGRCTKDEALEIAKELMDFYASKGLVRSHHIGLLKYLNADKTLTDVELWEQRTDIASRLGNLYGPWTQLVPARFGLKTRFYRECAWDNDDYVVVFFNKALEKWNADGGDYWSSELKFDTQQEAMSWVDQLLKEKGKVLV